MIYHEVTPIPRAKAELVFAGEDYELICDALVRAAYYDHDWPWVQSQCLRFCEDSRPIVREVAVVCLGHLARIHRTLDMDLVMPVLDRLLGDPEVAGTVRDTLGDIEMFANNIGETDWDKELTGDEREVCHVQAALFALCQKEYQCDAFDFVTKFMESDIAADMDKRGLDYGKRDPFEFIASLRGKLVAAPINEKKDAMALHWVGYVYRYWALLGMPSKDIVNIVPVESAYEVYYSFHTLDVREAIGMLAAQFERQL